MIRGGQFLYAVALKDDDCCVIQFYWAMDRGHAREQAVDSDPKKEIVAVAVVPY